MSITAPDTRVSTYNPVVPTTEFPALFPVFSDADLVVVHNGVERTDFTVSATYVEGIATNAKAVFSAGIVGAVSVVGARDPRRTNRFSNGANLPIWAQNLALDTLEGEMQEARRDIDRSHKAPIGQTGGVFAASDIEHAQENAAVAQQARDEAIAAKDTAVASAAAVINSAGSIKPLSFFGIQGVEQGATADRAQRWKTHAKAATRWMGVS